MRMFTLTNRIIKICLLFLLLSGSSKEGTSQNPPADRFARGADISWLPQMEATGYKFYSNKAIEEDCFRILKDHGINSIRLRTFVNPSEDKASGHCSRDETVAMAVRARHWGMKVMVVEVGGEDVNAQNTYDMLIAVQKKVQEVPGGKGTGVFYWEPEGARSWSRYALSAWGDDGKPTKAMDAFVQTNQSDVSNQLTNRIKQTKGLVALWIFDEKEGEQRKAIGQGKFPLTEMNGTLPRINEGPLSGFSAEFKNKAFLMLPNTKTGKLNISGKAAEVTVVAWVKWSGEQTGFVGGMWNEYQDGGKRQYGLFVSLPYYNGRDQVCGHISRTGKPTPPFPFSIDYSASKQRVPANEWCCVAFSYDGTYIKSYFNGKFEPRDPELIEHTKGFEGFPEGIKLAKNPWYFPDGMGDNGSDFTVGAVLLKSGMGNYFRGRIGGLAVFNRALPVDELSGFYP